MEIDPTRVYSIDEIKSKKVKLSTIDLKGVTNPEWVKFTGGIPDQVEAKESGSNIVIKVYDIQEVKYQKVVIEATKETPEAKGKNKGKYACVVKTYNAIIKDGQVTGYEETPASKSKTKYYKSEDIVTTYQMLNSKNQVLETSSDNFMYEETIIVNKDKVLGTLTYKNAQDFSEGLGMEDDYTKINLIKHIYEPVKKKNSYTGTWLQEEVSSTSANETFNLGVNREGLDADVINYDLSEKQGKDTINLVKGTKLKLNMSSTDNLTYYKSKNNNDVVIQVQSSEGEYTGTGYKKQVWEIEK